MNNFRTPQECTDTIVRSINQYLEKALCSRCALLMTGDVHHMAYDTVERIWVDHNVRLLDAETALD